MAERVLNIVYTVSRGTLDWVRGTNDYIPHQFLSNDGIYGDSIYRFTVISDEKFKISCFGFEHDVLATGTSVVTFKTHRHGVEFRIDAVDNNTVRKTILWVIEYL